MNPVPEQPVRTTPAEPRSREIVVPRCADVAADVDPASDEKTRAARRRIAEQAVDDAVEMTFPASDPPAWMSSGTPSASPIGAGDPRPAADGR